MAVEMEVQQATVSESSSIYNQTCSKAIGITGLVNDRVSDDQ